MTERPILFSAPMVLALLAGRKTQTRRVVKPQPAFDVVGAWRVEDFTGTPYASVGDRLWVKETWAFNGQAWKNYGAKQKRHEVFVTYAADQTQRTHYFPEKADVATPKQTIPEQRDDEDDWEYQWRRENYLTQFFRRLRPSIFMPRWASRIVLQVTEVRVERLNAITEADAKAEGIERSPGGPWRSYDREGGCCYLAAESYGSLWESINGPGSWDANPWVWVLEFRRLP